MDPDGEMEAEMDASEREALARADFEADAGEDGSVDREEFRFAIFQLADQWTNRQAQSRGGNTFMRSALWLCTVKVFVFVLAD